MTLAYSNLFSLKYFHMRPMCFRCIPLCGLERLNLILTCETGLFNTTTNLQHSLGSEADSSTSLALTHSFKVRTKWK